MTSRKGLLGGCSADEFDGLIRWALRGRVVGECPPPGMCERICALAERRTTWRTLGRGFRRGCGRVFSRVSDIDVCISALMDFWLRPQDRWGEWRFDPRFTCLVDQYSFLFQLAF